MTVHPWMLYGPRVLVVPPAPRSERPTATSDHGGVDVVALALRIALRVSRPGRQLAVSYAGRRLVRLHVRDRLGAGGGFRGVGYLHVQDDGQVTVTGCFNCSDADLELLARQARGDVA